VRLATELITARYPERRLHYFNEGIGGNTVIDLQNRWHDDVLRHQPDWVTVKIGINDLHRFLAQTETQVSPERFEEGYRDILTRTRDAGARLVLIDPFFISTDTESGHQRTRVLELLPQYIAIVGQMAREFDALHVATHDLFQRQLQFRPADYFCPEPVHPYASGHLVIAHGLLQAVGW
jgi:lysophospholipase L1-like esterase